MNMQPIYKQPKISNNQPMDKQQLTTNGRNKVWESQKPKT